MIYMVARADRLPAAVERAYHFFESVGDEALRSGDESESNTSQESATAYAG
jgi:hypothetical protein